MTIIQPFPLSKTLAQSPPSIRGYLRLCFSFSMIFAIAGNCSNRIHIVRFIWRKSDCSTCLIIVFALRLPSFQPRFCLCLREVCQLFDCPDRPLGLIRVCFTVNTRDALSFEEVLNLPTAQCSCVIAANHQRLSQDLKAFRQGIINSASVRTT